jgi:hypothetical protein
LASRRVRDFDRVPTKRSTTSALEYAVDGTQVVTLLLLMFPMRTNIFDGYTK